MTLTQTNGLDIDYNGVLDGIKADPVFQGNIKWGTPRIGHIEGTVQAHIDELIKNLDDLAKTKPFTEVERQRLLLLIYVHDSFKAGAGEKVPICAHNSHASLAASYLRQRCPDGDLVAMVQWHDEPYAIWRNATKGKVNQARLDNVFKMIKEWDLFAAFQIIDGCTISKSFDPVKWILEQANSRGFTRFTPEDLI